MRAHRFLLEIHAAGDATALRRVIPERLARVIPCERVSFNEMDTAPGRSSIVPVPVPLWWGRFGDVYQAHLLEHPLLQQGGSVSLHRVVDLDDPAHAGHWRKSALRHDYFVPLGIRHQLTVLTSRRGSRYTGVGLNRERRSYEARDRALLGYLSRHIAQAWKNVETMSALRGERRDPGAGLAPERCAIVAADSERGTVRAISPAALAMLRLHFGTDSGGQGKLTEEFRRWLRDQQARLAVKDALAATVPLTIRSASGHLTATLAQRLPEECVILLEVEPNAEVSRSRWEDKLTGRENEILGWLREGKRNREIGTILGISGRTVSKHVEHLLQKLGVETRTAAVRAWRSAGNTTRPDSVPPPS